jgi:hypothetical protein
MVRAHAAAAAALGCGAAGFVIGIILRGKAWQMLLATS